MEQITNYVKPELIVVAIALYFVGMALKQAQAVKDKYIPLILGGISIVICAIYVPLVPAGPDRILQWQFLQRLHREY